MSMCAKRLTVHPGTHTDPAGAQLEESVTFLAGQVLRSLLWC